MLGLGTAVFAASAGAIPSIPGPLPQADKAAHGAPPEDLGEPDRSNVAAGPASDISSPTTEGHAGPHGALTPVTPPCLHKISNDQSLTRSSEPTLCAEPTDRRERFSFRIGRRVRAGKSVLDQVDGMLVNYRLGNGMTLNGVAGYPAAATNEPVNLNRQVFGISAGMTRLAPAWDLSSYFIEHQKHGQTESRTLGSVLRYLRPKHSLLVSLDYDADESALSTFMVSGAWKLQRRTTLSATFDISRSNGHRGREGSLQQSLKATEGWTRTLPVDRIRNLTGEGSTQITSLGFGLSHRFSRHFALNGDLAVLDISKAAVSQTNEYFYNVKLSAKDLVLTGDRSALALHYNAKDSSRTSSATLDTKYRVNRMWQINPRVRTDYRSDASKNSVDWTTSPAVKMEYRWREAYGIEIEAGGKWSSHSFATRNRNESSYFLTLGYQASF
jgi:hypothetical protein